VFSILLVHQNYPGQFKHLGPALAAAGHQVFATRLLDAQGQGPKMGATQSVGGVTVHYYAASRSSTLTMHPWALDFETKVIRGEALFNYAKKLKQQGFEPNLILAHPGWGEALFLEHLWPKARLGLFCEWFYGAVGRDVGFDPEFPPPSDATLCGLTVKNLSYLSAMQWAAGGVAPTHWQASSFPQNVQTKLSVIHDGVDTQAIAPRSGATWPDALQKLGIPASSPLLTFINRNLEPYRGYHSFMRALPRVLAQNSSVHVCLVGGEEKGYGAAAPKGQTWRQVYEAEVFPALTDEQRARIHYLGKLPHSQLIQLYQASTVHVYLTYPFVLSWSLLEAMSAGCALVASRTAPVEEVIRHDENGLLVDFFNPNELAEKVLALLDDEKLRWLLGEQARQTVIDQYDLRTRCLPRQLDWVQSLL
jgi:glycosyltransferase involved in cell wall biosynthesis